MSAQSPTLTAVRYDGVSLVGLQWEPVDGAINFLTAVFDGDGRIVAQGTGFGVQGSVRLAGPLTSGSYTAAAAVKSDGAPVWGSTLPLVLERLRTLTASYADGTTVDARWSFPDGSFPNGATLVALDTSTGGELGQAVIFADAGQLTLTGPLDPAAPASRYVLQGGATLGGSVGPPLSAPLLATPARLRGLEYDPARPQLDAFLDQPVPDGGRAGLALYAGERLVQEAVAPTPSMAVALRPTAPLDPATAWSARPFWTVQGSRGPSGDPLAVVVEAPRIRDVRWEIGSLVVTWENAPGPPYPTGAQVEIKNGDSVWCGFVSTDPTGARFAPDPALQPLTAYTVTVAALHGGSQGPPSAEVPVVVGRSALTGVAYDGRAVRASWSDSPPIAAREARLLVRAGELIVAEVGAIARQAAVEVALEPGGLYTASLVWVNAATGSRGPEGPRTPLVTGAALLATAAVDGGDVTLAWSDPPDDARTVSGLQAVFSSPGFPPRTTALARAQPTVAIAAPSSDPLVPVSVAVQALGSGAAGPLSGALPLLRDAPAVTRAALGDDGALQVEWAPVAGAVGSYLVTVTRDGAALATANVPADRTGAALPLGAVVPSAAYAVTVVARAGGARGPLPAAATSAIATAPALGAAAFDGTTATVPLTAPAGGGPAPDRYELELLRDGAVVQRATVAVPAPGAPLALAVAPALDRDGRFALAVRAGSGAALGPAATTAVLLAAPRVEQVACDGAAIVATVATGAQPRDGLTLTAALSVDGVEQQSRAVDGDGRAAFTAPGGGRVTIAARGQRGGATGPWSEPVTALTSRPALASVRCDDGRVTIAWTPPGPTEAALLTAAGTVVASVRVDGDHAVLEPPAGVAPPLSVRVVAHGERATGPAATSAVLTAAPAVQQLLTDPLTGAATVSFDAVAGPPAASGYEVQLLSDGAPHGDPIETATTSARLPALAGLFDLAVAVRARGGGAGQPALTGPYGAALPLLTRAPAAVSADFDGLTVLARWTPVAGATGHRVAVVADGRAEPIAQQDAPAGADALRLAVRLPDTTSAWQLAVQPLLGASSGPPAHAPLFAPGLYLRSDGQPRIFRAATPALQPQATSTYLPEIGPLGALPLPDTPADAPLRIVANDDGASRAAFPYRLAIGGAALDFSAGEPIRAAVWSASETLLARAEAAGATPWGIVQLQQAISRLLPQTFAETLLYAYGLSPTTGSADLRPGMVLRVAAGGYELMPSNRPPAWAQGYAGGAAADYEIADYLDVTPLPADAPWLLGFDGYLSWLCANGALAVPPPQQESGLQSGAADAADLYWPLFRQPFYRLFAPVELQAATPPAVAQTRQQFTLAAAATHRLISGARAAASPGVAVAYFRGRAVARLLIRVVVDGESQLVPIGTTVGNVLDRLARRPPRAATALRGLALQRSNGPLVLDPSAYAAGGGMPVALGYGGLATFDRRDALSLPLLHGDRLTLGEAAR